MLIRQMLNARHIGQTARPCIPLGLNSLCGGRRTLGVYSRRGSTCYLLFFAPLHWRVARQSTWIAADARSSVYGC